ncbi:MAG TPA: T9SS type A sorting domain-containing protein [Bacteroidia bacterium]|nr:T9SS type A sorting domain-containing protein [Bacteroidia bacterium]
MKKIFLLTFIALTTAYSSFAQEIKISKGGQDYSNGSIDAWFDITDYQGNSAYTFHGFTVKNTGTSAKTIRMIRQQLDTIPGTSNYFCWEACYSPETDTSLGNIILNPNGEFLDMYLDYAPKGNLGVSTVRYILQNVADLNDTSSILVRFNATPTSISEINATPKLNSIYPNPANNNVTVNFALNQGQASLELKNLLGQVQRIIPVVAGSKSTNLNVADLPSGIYFVTLKSNGNIIDTKRLMVN